TTKLSIRSRFVRTSRTPMVKRRSTAPAPRSRRRRSAASGTLTRDASPTRHQHTVEARGIVAAGLVVSTPSRPRMLPMTDREELSDCCLATAKQLHKLRTLLYDIVKTGDWPHGYFADISTILNAGLFVEKALTRLGTDCTGGTAGNEGAQP